MLTGWMQMPFSLLKESFSWTERWLDHNEKFLNLTLLRPDPEPAWSTPHTCILDLTPLRLLSFAPEGTDHSNPETIPTLIVTPQVNHSYICDYAPGQSLVATLKAHGLQNVYATEWKCATPARAHETLDDVLATIETCIDAIGGRANIVGLCQGGWMGLIHTALRPQQVNALVLAAAPVDFHEDPGMVNIMARFMYPMAFYEYLVALGGGVMRGDFISTGFNNLRAGERYVSKYLDLWTQLDDDEYVERYKQLDNWYGLNQNIPGAAYLRIVRELFKENRLVQGTLHCRGERVDLKRVTAPTHLIAGTRDHITRPGQLLATHRYISTRPEQCYTYEVDAGHIGVFMGHKALKKVWPRVTEQILQDTHAS